MDEGNETSAEAASDAGPGPAQLKLGESELREDLNHKLRTPLNAIIGFAELLALQPGSKQEKGDVQQILKSAREMLAIIETELGGPGRETGEQNGMLRTCDVLYVEDDEVNATLVGRILELRPGLKMVHADHGRAGLALAARTNPKLILLDLNLPDMHGSELLRSLQQNPVTAAIPVVVLSADAGSLDRPLVPTCMGLPPPLIEAEIAPHNSKIPMSAKKPTNITTKNSMSDCVDTNQKIGKINPHHTAENPHMPAAS